MGCKSITAFAGNSLKTLAVINAMWSRPKPVGCCCICFERSEDDTACFKETHVIYRETVCGNILPTRNLTRSKTVQVHEMTMIGRATAFETWIPTFETSQCNRWIQPVRQEGKEVVWRHMINVANRIMFCTLIYDWWRPEPHFNPTSYMSHSHGPRASAINFYMLVYIPQADGHHSEGYTTTATFQTTVREPAAIS